MMLVLALYLEVINTFFMFVLLIVQPMLELGSRVLNPYINHTSWKNAVAPTDIREVGP